MSTQEAILEAAKAAHEAMRHSHALDGASIPAWEDDDTQDFWIEVTGAAIRAYLSELEKAGPLGTSLTVAPKDTLTMGQIDAGEKALAGLDLTTATPEQIVQRVYFATVQAAPKPPGADL